MINKVEFFRHALDEKDMENVQQVLRSLFLTTGEQVAGFEEKLGTYLGGRHVVGVTSCTAALHLSLMALGVKPGDEVITTPLSFCASSNAILHAGGTPVFVDVEKETGNINAEAIEGAITENTVGILPVHLYGQMCDMKRIREIADRHGLFIVEDAAHCLEGRRDGIQVGERGDAACFSFYATKNLTSGEGGAISVHTEQMADLLRELRLHGMNKSAADRYSKKYQHWDMVRLGWKYNMDNIHGALLLEQLDRIEQLLKKREEIAQTYSRAFIDTPGVGMPAVYPGSKHARHLFTLWVDERDDVLHHLQEKGVGVAVNFRPIHLLGYYRKRFGYQAGAYPVAEEIGARTLSIPLYPSLREEEVLWVTEKVREVII